MRFLLYIFLLLPDSVCKFCVKILVTITSYSGFDIVIQTQEVLQNDKSRSQWNCYKRRG